jgi:choline kinase
MPSDIIESAGIRAVILAAGVGRRLGGASMPKAMLEFGGQTLLHRHIAVLSRAGVADITLVTGFGAEHIRAAVHALGDPCAATLLINPDFREGSVVSLWVARDVLRSRCPILLMDADVLYDDRMMARLLNSAHPNCLLLDREIEPGDEPVKICVAGGRIVDFHKRPSASHDWHGESVGFFRFDAATACELADRVDEYVRSGRRAMEYEEPIRDMIMQSAAGRFGYEDISGLPWTEIDFADDVAKADGLVGALA